MKIFWQSRNACKCPLAGRQSNGGLSCRFSSKYFYFRLTYYLQHTPPTLASHTTHKKIINYRRRKHGSAFNFFFRWILVAFTINEANCVAALSLVDLPVIRILLFPSVFVLVASKMIPTHVQVCSDSFYPDLYFD